MDGVAQEQNNKEVEMQSLAEKYELPLEAVKGICNIFEKIRSNGMTNVEAMDAVKELSDQNFESEETPEVNPA